MDHADHTTNGTYTESFSIPAPAADGTYNAYFIVYANNLCSSGASTTYSMANAVVVDGPPTVVSIARAAASPTTGSSVSWTVTFSESVTGVGASDFLLTSGLRGTPAVTGVSGSGTVYTVTANTGTGSGTLGLNLLEYAECRKKNADRKSHR